MMGDAGVRAGNAGVAAEEHDASNADPAGLLSSDAHGPWHGSTQPLRIAPAPHRAVVPLVALGRQHAPLAQELRAAFDRVAHESAFILGEEVECFEAEFAEFCSVRHCVGVASGTAALTIALIAAGIGPGDEVIVPAHTFISSALAVVHAGATVVFCDVERDTGLIDVDAAAAAVGSSTAAILPVHLYGQACNMQAVRALAQRHGLLVIEDAAQAHGATYRERPVGGLGSAAAFSFYPSKNLGALGDGGAICTDDPDLAEQARRLRNVGQRRKGEHIEMGFNERLDGLQAALLRVKLPHLAAGNRARRRHAAQYRGALAEEVLLVERPESPCVYHVFPILVRDRDETAAALAHAGIATGVHYDCAASDHPLWRGRMEAGSDLDVARSWAAHELSLPMFPELEEHELTRVIQACAGLGYGKSTNGRHVA
jgi:dTDP-3-amino-3,4,6-trideoxy-alpha-D-glucose transaminase